jgi:DNA-binding NarL/FixJ family response regulator
MRSLVPESKIIFLTRESSADVVQKAFSVGARGYVTKNMVLPDLFVAVATVISGMTFVSNLSATATFNFRPEFALRY